MADWDFILAPTSVEVTFELDQVAIVFNSLRLLNLVEQHSGLGEWVLNTSRELSEDRLRTNEIVLNVIAEHFTETHYNENEFPKILATMPDNLPDDYTAAALGWLRDRDDYPGDDVVFGDVDTFLSYMHRVLTDKYDDEDFDFNADYWGDLYAHLQQPQRLTALIMSHLQYMWDAYLKAEWQHVFSTLEDAYRAFTQMDYSDMNAYEVIEAVTGRNVRGKEKLNRMLQDVQHLTFVPSPHLGPYIGWRRPEDNGIRLTLLFGARAPRNAPAVTTSALSRSELLVRLNALSDETRLSILELLTRHEELCAQDFITSLDLSQSSASRHLRQLTASGYIAERRRDVAKCYTLNPERIDDTINALRDFLQRDAG